MFNIIIYMFAAKSKKTNKHLYVTDGTKERFPGLGIYFVRTNPKAITPANIAQEVYFGVLESNGGGLLEAVEVMLSKIYIPAIREQSSWGKIADDAAGHAVKTAFLGKLDSFVAVLANARASIANCQVDTLYRSIHNSTLGPASSASFLICSDSVSIYSIVIVCMVTLSIKIALPVQFLYSMSMHIILQLPRFQGWMLQAQCHWVLQVLLWMDLYRVSTWLSLQC